MSYILILRKMFKQLFDLVSMPKAPTGRNLDFFWSSVCVISGGLSQIGNTMILWSTDFYTFYFETLAPVRASMW